MMASEPYEFLCSVRREMVTTAAMGAAYEKWSDDYARKTVRSVWADDDADILRKQRNRKLSVHELRQMSDDELALLGFGRWSEDMPIRLIPLWAFNYIAPGERLTCIDGNEATIGENDIDLDVRFGCIAYGFLPAA